MDCAGGEVRRGAWQAEYFDRLALTDVRVVAQLAERVVTPAQDRALADATGVRTPGNDGRDGTAHENRFQPIQGAAVAELPVAVQAPAEGVATLGQAAGVIPPGPDRAEDEAAPNRAGHGLAVSCTVAELPAEVFTPAQRHAASREAACVAFTGREHREAEVGAHGRRLWLVRARTVTNLPTLVGPPALGPASRVERAGVSSAGRNGYVAAAVASTLSPLISASAREEAVLDHTYVTATHCEALRSNGYFGFLEGAGHDPAGACVLHRGCGRCGDPNLPLRVREGTCELLGPLDDAEAPDRGGQTRRVRPSAGRSGNTVAARHVESNLCVRDRVALFVHDANDRSRGNKLSDGGSLPVSGHDDDVGCESRASAREDADRNDRGARNARFDHGQPGLQGQLDERLTDAFGSRTNLIVLQDAVPGLDSKLDSRVGHGDTAAAEHADRDADPRTHTPFEIHSGNRNDLTGADVGRRDHRSLR